MITTKKKFKGEYTITNQYGVEFTASYQPIDKYWNLSSWDVDDISINCGTLKECKLYVERSYNELKLN
jgi:hypothetical protein